MTVYEDYRYEWDRESLRVSVIESISGMIAEEANALELWWHAMGRTMIDVTMLTLALGFLTFLTAILSYLVISRRLRDSYLTLAIWIIPEWVSSATSLIMAISKAAQEYAFIETYIPAIRSGTVLVDRCVIGADCIGSSLQHLQKPIYNAHGCVGTWLIMANVLIQEGVICALVLFFVLPEHNFGKVLRGIAVAPFLAACVSAALNVLDVQKRCWPGDFIAPSGMRIQRQGEVFEPHGLDPATAKLTQISHMVALAVLALWVWQYRHGLLAQLQGSSANGYACVRPLLFTCVLPPAVIKALAYLRNLLNGGRHGPVWLLYVLFCAASSFLSPLMRMWPGIVMISWRLTMPENILPVSQGKDDVGAVSPAPNPQSRGAADTKSLEGPDAVIASDADPSEKSPIL